MPRPKLDIELLAVLKCDLRKWEAWAASFGYWLGVIVSFVALFQSCPTICAIVQREIGAWSQGRCLTPPVRPPLSRPSFPSVFQVVESSTNGLKPKQRRDNVMEAIEAHLQVLREEGREIPGEGEVLLAKVEV